MKEEFIKRLHNEESDGFLVTEGLLTNFTSSVKKAMEINAKMNTQRGHYEKWKEEEAKKKASKPKK